MKEQLRCLARNFIAPVGKKILDVACKGSGITRSVTKSKNNVFQSNELPPFPMDVVYTWVDNNDADWLRSKEKWAEMLTNDNLTNSQSLHASRFSNKDELKYSIRSLCKYLVGFNKIYIVTNGQKPNWLLETSNKIEIISHSEIFPDTEATPTFNSHAIEACIHRIPGLSEHFIYLNDDLFIGKSVTYADFFEIDGTTVDYLSNEVVDEGPALLSETGFVWSIKNSRNLLRLRSGQFCRKIAHTPHAFRKSILVELSCKYSTQIDKTIRTKFRSIDDIGVTTSLYQYYSAINSKGKLIDSNSSTISTKYINLGSPILTLILAKLLYSKNTTFFCLNESISNTFDSDSINPFIAKFLESYYPEKSEFEK